MSMVRQIDGMQQLLHFGEHRGIVITEPLEQKRGTFNIGK